MKNYFKRNCFFILFVFLMFQSHSTLWAMDGAGMAFKVSLSGKIYHQFSFLLEEDIRPKSNFKQAEWFLINRRNQLYIQPVSESRSSLYVT